MSREMKGALFFSKEHPHIQGYLVIDGEHFEIAGWQASEVKAEIKARRTVPIQEEMFDECPGKSREGERDIV